MRNAAVTCIAPTGTISLLANTSSGIEPIFAYAMVRRVLDDQILVEFSPTALRVLEELGAVGEVALQEVREHGSIRRVAGLPEKVRRRFPIALEIPAAFHVRMQASFQSHMDAAVSKTVNLPPAAPPSAVREVFLLAHRLGLKGVTVYRYGSRPGQTFSVVQEEARRDCRECAE